MTNPQVADLLLEYLAVLPSHELPQVAEIAEAINPHANYRFIYDALADLRNHGRITWRHGDRKTRGHQAIYVLATRRAYWTVGCPFDPVAPVCPHCGRVPWDRSA